MILIIMASSSSVCLGKDRSKSGYQGQTDLDSKWISTRGVEKNCGNAAGTMSQGSREGDIVVLVNQILKSSRNLPGPGNWPLPQ